MRASDLLVRIGDATFLLDHAGSVSGWNPAAERLLGYSRDEVLGRPCSDVLRCTDLSGRPLCLTDCLLTDAILKGKPSPAVELLARHRDGQVLQAGANVAPVNGEVDARALVMLRPSASGIIATSSDPRSPGEVDLAGSLERLRIVTGADAVELFLAAPRGEALVLAAHRGKSPRAFKQILSFEPGQGFPGIVAQTGQPLLSVDLQHDDRYLRSAVKRSGFRTYLCAPVWGSSGVIGSLNLASRRKSAALTQYLPYLTTFARNLGLALERERLLAAASVAQEPFFPHASTSENLRLTTEQTLRRLIEIGGLDCGLVLLRPDTPGSGEFQPLSEINLPRRVRRVLARSPAITACPGLLGETCPALSSSSSVVHPLCEALRHELATAVYVPLSTAGEVLGAVVIGSRARDSLPAARLNDLHAAIGSAAVVLHNALLLRRDELRHALPSTEVAERGPHVTPDSAPCSANPETAGQGDVPFLDLRCFGQFTVVRDGRTVPAEQFTRRPALTLLKILLMAYGRQIHREELMELLWPQADPRSSAALLKVVVHSLRHGLEPSLPRGSPSSFIRTSGPYYAFSTESPHRLDTRDFTKVANQGKVLDAHGQRTEALSAYGRACALYSGDLLEDERYSDWCAMERECLRETLISLLRRMAQLYRDARDLDAAIDCYRRALTAEPTLEDVHRSLMQTLWHAGRRDEALRQYRDCRAVLKRELDVSPAPETEALRHQISAHAGSSSVPAPR
ncbi:MAG: BTAD domain-containing putative transcriptional regulator [Chloroflexota bacterium]